MNNTYRKWRARPEVRPAYTWTEKGEYVRLRDETETWVLIDAPDGREWEVLAAVEEDADENLKPYVVALTVRGGRVTPELLRQQPLDTLARVAVAVQAEVEALWITGSPIDEALDLAAGPVDPLGNPSHRAAGRPSHIEFAAVWKFFDGARPAEVTPLNGDVVEVDPAKTTRERVANYYGKSAYLIDKWLKDVRDEHPDLIPKKKPGRPRKTTAAKGGGKGTRKRAATKKNKE